MSFHVLGWTGNIADATATSLTPITDQIFAIQNGNFFPTRAYQLLWAAGVGTNLTLGRLITPFLRQVTTPYIRPLNNGADFPNLPGIADYRANPFTLRGLEEIQLDGTQDSGGTSRVWFFSALQEQPRPMPGGDIWTMRGTDTTTLVANSWTTLNVTWQDMLPAGTYEVVGLTATSASAKAVRIIFDDQILRPGSICTVDIDNQTSDIFRKGRLGGWGRFDSNRMPNFEMLADAGDTAEELYLDFVRVG